GPGPGASGLSEPPGELGPERGGVGGRVVGGRILEGGGCEHGLAGLKGFQVVPAVGASDKVAIDHPAVQAEAVASGQEREAGPDPCAGINRHGGPLWKEGGWSSSGRS